MRLRTLSILLLTGAFSCLPSASTPDESEALKGDHLYRGVLAGSGSGTMGSGTFSAIYLDPANAGAAPKDNSTRPTDPELSAKLSLGGGMPVELHGPVKNRHASLTGPGGSAELDIHNDGTVHGSYKNDSDGSDGKMAAVDDTTGKAESLCGTFDGDASGTWNFVISADGVVAGSFYGLGASGDISGSATATSVSIQWSGSDGLGDSLSGTATASLSNGTVSGNWSGGGYSGTFTSMVGCATDPDPDVSMSPPDSAQCGCSQTPIPAGGACCQGGPVGSYCCASYQ